VTDVPPFDPVHRERKPGEVYYSHYAQRWLCMSASGPRPATDHEIATYAEPVAPEPAKPAKKGKK
jgi:hypothetical protein